MTQFVLALSGEEVPADIPESISRDIGLIRSEYIFRRYGVYPSKESCGAFLFPYLSDVCREVGSAAVWYRTLEVDAVEANTLQGVEEIITDEPYRLMGLRGIRRSIRHPGPFVEEVSALALVHEMREEGRTGVILPFVSQVEEVVWGAGQIRSIADGKLRVASMIETPAALLLLPELIEQGQLDRVVVGVNDLSSLLEGLARGVSRPVLPTPALRRAIQSARYVTSERGTELAVAGYLSADLMDFCAGVGADDIVVHYSDVSRLFGDVYRLPEQDLVKEIKARTRRDIEAMGGPVI